MYSLRPLQAPPLFSSYLAPYDQTLREYSSVKKITLRSSNSAKKFLYSLCISGTESRSTAKTFKTTTEIITSSQILLAESFDEPSNISNTLCFEIIFLIEIRAIPRNLRRPDKLLLTPFGTSQFVMKL